MARADARENRARILEVARTAFVADGATSMNQIAQRAGVGAGTLYRHFATREALVLAVYQEEVDRLVAGVGELLAELPPLEALRQWMTELIESMRRKHGLGDALSSTAHQAIAEQSYGPVVAAIATLLDAGKHDASIRPDADPGDVLQFTAALWRAPSTPEDRVPRMLTLLLDGLRVQEPRSQ